MSGAKKVRKKAGKEEYLAVLATVFYVILLYAGINRIDGTFLGWTAATLASDIVCYSILIYGVVLISHFLFRARFRVGVWVYSILPMGSAFTLYRNRFGLSYPVSLLASITVALSVWGVYELSRYLILKGFSRPGEPKRD